MEEIKKLPNIEFEVMKVVWAHEPPITTNIVMEHLGYARNWRKESAISFLLRLVNRGFLRTEKNSKERTFYPLVEKEDYLKFETDNFVKQFHDGSIMSLLSTRYSDGALSDKDIDELLSWAEDRRI